MIVSIIIITPSAFAQINPPNNNGEVTITASIPVFTEFIKSLSQGSGTGTQGEKGDTGEQGIQGPQGIPGTDGSNTSDQLALGTLFIGASSPNFVQGINNNTFTPMLIFDALQQEEFIDSSTSGFIIEQAGTYDLRYSLSVIGGNISGNYIFAITQNGQVIDSSLSMITSSDNTSVLNVSGMTVTNLSQSDVVNISVMTDEADELFITANRATYIAQQIS